MYIPPMYIPPSYIPAIIPCIIGLHVLGKIGLIGFGGGGGV